MQKKITLFLISALAGGAILIWSFGFFPVMRVNGEYILYRAYENRVSAFVLFEEQSRRVAGGEESAPVVLENIQKSVLTGLIAQAVFRQYAENNAALTGVFTRAEDAVSITLENADPNVLPEATKQLYGWSVEEFSDNVLYPQALQNEIVAFVERDGASFEEFARTQFAGADVQLYGVPWRWENGALVEK